MTPAAGGRQQRLVEAARQQQPAALRADVADIEREAAQQAELRAQVPLVQPRDYVVGTGHAVGELRGGSPQHVAERGGGKRLLQAGEVVAGIRIGEALREGRRGELRKPGGLVEESVASAHRKPAAGAKRLPREAEARGDGIERRRVAVLAAGGSHEDTGGRRSERLAGIRVDQPGVVVGRHGVAQQRARRGRNRRLAQQVGPRVADRALRYRAPGRHIPSAGRDSD